MSEEMGKKDYIRGVPHIRYCRCIKFYLNVPAFPWNINAVNTDREDACPEN
jgi:hypothetical protein